MFRLILESSVPPECGPVSLSYETIYLSPVAQPVNNVVTFLGTSRDPATIPGVSRLCPAAFRRGDCNRDGVVDISDPLHAISFLFLGGPAPECLDAADANDDGRTDLADPVSLLVALFGSPALSPIPAPGPSDCGGDPTADAIGCDADCR